MSLRINPQAPSFTADNTQGKIDFRQWVPEADAEGDRYGENGERMPYYPARPRQRGPYDLVWDQNAWRSSSARAPSPRLGPRTLPLVKIMGAAAIALLASNTLANAAENPARLAQEQHACAVVLGLDSSGRRYDACVRSLERSLSEWDYTRTVSAGRDTCAGQGLQPGAPAFAVCVLNAEQSQ